MEDKNTTKNTEKEICEELTSDEETSKEKDLPKTSEKSENEDEFDYEVRKPFVKINGVTDLILEVDSTWFYVNKGILVACSPVFKDMICSTDTSVLKLDDNESDLLSFLESLYPSILAPVTMTNFDAVLKLSVKYQVAALLEMCDRTLEDYFQRSNGAFKLDQLLNKLQIAENNKLSSAEAAGLHEVVRYNCSTIDWKPITNELKIKIMSRRLNKLESVVYQLTRDCNSCSDCQKGRGMKSWNKVQEGNF